MQFPERYGISINTAPTPEELTALAVDVVSRAKEAEEAGYDAIVIYNSYDPGLEAAMSMVRIPVIGTGRSGFGVASMLADRISIVAPYSSFIPMTYRFVASLGLAGRVTPIRALDIPIGTIASRKEETGQKFAELARKGLADGGQIIFPIGLNSLSVHLPINDLGIPCPIIDCVPLAIRLAEMFVKLGIRQSKLAYPGPNGK